MEAGLVEALVVVTYRQPRPYPEPSQPSPHPSTRTSQSYQPACSGSALLYQSPKTKAQSGAAQYVKRIHILSTITQLLSTNMQILPLYTYDTAIQLSANRLLKKQIQQGIQLY